MNFFHSACQSGPHHEATFGLCDDKGAGSAYVDVDSPSAWVATVENPSRRSLTFTAIDKCVVRDDEAPGRLRCDAMLVSRDLLYLVELKDQRAHWRSLAVEQLGSTIRLLREHHAAELEHFRYKKAFVCNRRNGHFKVLDHEMKRRFFQTYGFRIDVHSTISIPAFDG